jgi:hypothetical protein
MRMCGDIFAAARLWRGRLLTTGHLSSHPVVWVRGTWRGGRGGGAGGSVGVLRARRCHLRAGFQQCKSFVEKKKKSNVHRKTLSSMAPSALSHGDGAPGCWCGGLHHQRTQILAG